MKDGIIPLIDRGIMVIISDAIEPGNFKFWNNAVFINSNVEKHQLLWKMFNEKECFYAYIWKQKDLTFDEKLTASCRHANAKIKEQILLNQYINSFNNPLPKDLNHRFKFPNT